MLASTFRWQVAPRELLPAGTGGWHCQHWVKWGTAGSPLPSWPSLAEQLPQGVISGSGMDWSLILFLQTG